MQRTCQSQEQRTLRGLLPAFHRPKWWLSAASFPCPWPHWTEESLHVTIAFKFFVGLLDAHYNPEDIFYGFVGITDWLGFLTINHQVSHAHNTTCSHASWTQHTFVCITFTRQLVHHISLHWNTGSMATVIFLCRFRHSVDHVGCSIVDC